MRSHGNTRLLRMPAKELVDSHSEIGFEGFLCIGMWNLSLNLQIRSSQNSDSTKAPSYTRPASYAQRPPSPPPKASLQQDGSHDDLISCGNDLSSDGTEKFAVLRYSTLRSKMIRQTVRRGVLVNPWLSNSRSVRML